MSSKIWLKLFSAVVVFSLALSLAISPHTASARTAPPIQGTGALAEAISLPSAQELAKFATRADGTVDVMLEMAASPSAMAYTETLKAKGSSSQASLDAKTRFQQIDLAQKSLLKSLDALKTGASVLFRAQRAYNGVAISIAASKIKSLSSLPGVKAVHVMVPKQIDNSSTIPMINAPFAWQYGLSYRGTGIRIGVIDTGIDYLHTDLGGAGTEAAYLANDTTVVGDAPNYPGIKVAGGYDFAGDDYNATTVPNPSPDFDPMDCNGHGSHVSGTIAGYGLNADGTTYTGSYGPGTDFANLRIGPGVAPDATLYGLRVFGCGGSTDLVVGAIDWAVDPNGDGDPSDHLDVINMSLGSGFGSAGYDADSIASENASLAGVIVVASAGNAGDTHYDVGSPSTATSAISVASMIDPVDIMDGFEVTLIPPAAPALNKVGAPPSTIFGSSNSSNGWASVSSVTAELVFPNSPTNPGGCSAWLAGQFTGKIVLLDWTYTFAPSSTSQCGSSARVLNAGNAGAVGVIFANTKPYLDIAIAGNAIAPSTITTQATGNILKAAVGLGTVSATLTKAHNGSVRNVDISVSDSVSSFSSRGPRRIDNFLKPDIAAPGQSVYSILALSGNLGESLNGTSMAAPHMTGVMALLRQLHPDWTVEELKALAMNTATHDLTTIGAGVGDTYSGPRVGAGRVDVMNAVLDNVIAYNATDTGAVSVSFGSVEVPVDGTKTLYKDFIVSNKNGILTDPITLTVAYEANSSLVADGITFSVVDASGDPVSAVTLNSGQQATLRVKMVADGAAMKHTLDKTMYTQQGTTSNPAVRNRYWMAEAGGNVVLGPQLGPQTKTASVRMPVYATARPIASMHATTSSLALLGSSGTASLKLQGVGIDSGEPSPAYPVDTVSLVSALELKATSPQLTGLSAPIFSTGDFQYVGVMTDHQSAGSWAATAIYFGISTYGDWTTPTASGDEYDIYIDTDGDGSPEWDIFNYRHTADANGNPTDVFRAAAYDLTTGSLYLSGYLNGVTPNILNTSVYNTNVMVMPVSAALLGLSDANPSFTFWLESYSREWSGPIDTVASDIAPLSYNALHLAVDTVSANPAGPIPMFADLPDFTIPVIFNKAYATGPLSLLLLHHHNGEGTRAEAITLLDNQMFFPFSVWDSDIP